MAEKICFVISSLQAGGAERVLSNLASQLSQTGYEVTLICLNNKEIKHPPGLKVKLQMLLSRKEGAGLPIRMYYAFQTFGRLIKILRKEKPVCVVSFMTTSNLWTGICAGLLRIPYVVSERTSPDYSLNNYSKPMQWFAFQVYTRAIAIVVPAEKMIEGFKKNVRYKQRGNFKIIRNPLHFFKAPGKTAVHEKQFILSSGRLEYNKGFDLLINAYHKLMPADVDLIITGEGPYRKNLEGQIRSLGLEDKVKLVGFTTDMEDYYSQAAVFVLASRVEGYPNVLIEAMSMGCACIAMDCEYGPSEIIQHKLNGLLIPVENTAVLKQSIDLLLSDKILHQTLSKNAKFIKETHSMEQIAHQWVELIRK